MTYQLHIVTHCYAAKLPHYAQALRYQLSSLTTYKKNVRTVVEVCCVDEDVDTQNVLDWFVCNTSLNLIISRLSVENISCRAIGRNLAALSSHAELIWFTDVDYVFHTGCIDGLWAAWESLHEYASMLYPSTVNVHKDHQTGDNALAQEDCDGLIFVKPDDFFPTHYTRAIGGIQIVPGSLARDYGYLNASKRYQTPLSEPFKDFRDDIAFRRFCKTKGPIVKVDFPGLYRLRHSRTTYQPDICHGTPVS